MNSLQAGLIGVSVLVIALFAAWMWWQSWRSSRAQRTPRAHSPADSTKQTLRAETSAPALTPTVRLRDAALAETAPAAQTAVADDPSFNADGVGTSEALARIDERSEPRIELSDHAAREPSHAPRVERAPGFHDPAVEVAASSAMPHAAASATPVARSSAVALDTSVADAATATSAAASASVQTPVQHATTLSPNTVATPSAMPIDERLNVYALVTARDGQAVDCAEFASLADRSFAWGRVFRMSAWEPIEDIASGGAVQSLCLALPIATRAGPLTDRDAIEWKRSVSGISDRRDFEVSFGGDVGVSDRAQELDQFLAAADVICVLYLVRKDAGAWSGTRLRGTLEANGFRLQADGRFVYFEVESETPIFSAVDGFERSFSPERLRTENVTALRLVFEASNVANPVARFDVYRQTLRALARLLEAEIKDSSGTVVGDAEFTVLRSDVAAGSTALAEAGIECGSVTAQSLFR